MASLEILHVASFGGLALSKTLFVVESERFGSAFLIVTEHVGLSPQRDIDRTWAVVVNATADLSDIQLGIPRLHDQHEAAAERRAREILSAVYVADMMYVWRLAPDQAIVTSDGLETVLMRARLAARGGAK